MAAMRIPFNRPYMTGRELWLIAQAHAGLHLSGDGPYTHKCHTWLQERMRSPRAFLTHSCTAALELAVLLADTRPGDEIIMPSFTFVSTANAVVLRGGVPVFVDIRPDTLNIDEKLIEAAITPRTTAIMTVHYAGVGCEMDAIMDIARRHDLLVFEDAAHGIMASYRGRPLGSIGHLAGLSFHETKNVISGEGGALLVNDDRFASRAEVMREKGTNRTQFFRGEVDKYTWVDMGSSYLPSDIVAAFLYAQLEEADRITAERLALWREYHEALAPLEERGLLRRPVTPDHCEINAHMYYVLLRDRDERDGLMNHLKSQGIHAVFHYIPLHSAPAGLKYGRAVGELPVTDRTSDTLLRLPLWVGLKQVDEVAESIAAYLTSR